MSRTAVRMGVLALSALVAMAAIPAKADDSQQALTQSVDTGIKDAQAKRVQGDYAGAIHILSQLMLVAPDDSRVVGEYGKVLIQQGRAKSAIDFLTRAVQLQQGNWTFYSALGAAYDQVGDFKNARNAYEIALQLKPDEPVILNNYAMSRMLAGDLPQAKKLIAIAAKNSNDPRIVRNVKLIDGLEPTAVASAAPPPAPPVRHPAPTPVKVEPLSPPKSSVAAHAPTPLTKPAGEPAMAKAAEPVARTAVKPVPEKVAHAEKPVVPTARPAAPAHKKPVAVATTKPGVIMQKVPYDPMAGTVYKHGKPTTHVAAHPATTKAAKAAKPAATKTAKAKPAKTEKPKKPLVAGIPALRLANDTP